MQKNFFPAVALIIAHFAVAIFAPDFVGVSIAHLLIIYGILATLTALHILCSIVVKKQFSEQAGLIVIALNMLKMILAMILLFVVVVPLAGKSATVAINFLVAYFAFIFLDSVFAILILNKDKK